MAQEAIHEQIKMLEAQLEAKKKELGSDGDAKESKEIMREVIKDIAQNPVAFPAPQATSATTANDDEKKLAELKEKEHEHVVQELLDIAISKDVFSALKTATALKNPHIEDEFHDKLATYFDTLIASRKIKT